MMNNLQREINQLKATHDEAEREKKAHRAQVKKRAKSMWGNRCIRKIVKSLGSIPKEH